MSRRHSIVKVVCWSWYIIRYNCTTFLWYLGFYSTMGSMVRHVQ